MRGSALFGSYWSVVYPTLPEALQQRWDQMEQDLADELITLQVGAHSGGVPLPTLPGIPYASSTFRAIRSC